MQPHDLQEPELPRRLLLGVSGSVGAARLLLVSRRAPPVIDAIHSRTRPDSRDSVITELQRLLRALTNFRTEVPRF